jgi:hypothetical protein
MEHQGQPVPPEIIKKEIERLHKQVIERIEKLRYKPPWERFRDWWHEKT